MLRVIAHDPYMAADDVTAHGATPVSFDELIEQSDYLVIKAPLTKETHHRIGEPELRRMKPTLILVNTARGPIVNDAALHLALKDRWIAGAGLDDIEEEAAKLRNWKPENPLFSLAREAGDKPIFPGTGRGGARCVGGGADSRPCHY